MTTVTASRVAKVSDDEYFAMVEAGVFGDRRVFLWGGRLFEKMAKTKAHVYLEGTISDALRAVALDPWIVRGENPLRLGGRYVPLPDVVVVRGPWSRYRDRRATPDDVGLVAEIAVTSLAHDLSVQAAVYARAEVACYWVVDALHRRVIEHRGPCPDGTYATVREHGPGDHIDVVLAGALAGRIAVADLF
jgi:Uma2 family endonuclease